MHAKAAPGARQQLFEPPDLHPRKAVDPRLPDLLVDSFAHIPFALLAKRGIVHYCLDLDNTLVLQAGENPDPDAVEALRQARASGYVKHVCLISNTIWGAHRVRRLRRLARQLDIPHVFPAQLWNRKPSPTPFLWALSRMGSTPPTTAVVGDQIFSDIVGGNKLGMFTILVPPLGPDHWTTRIVGRRWRERRVLRKYGLGFNEYIFLGKEDS